MPFYVQKRLRTLSTMRPAHNTRTYPLARVKAAPFLMLRNISNFSIE
jgi:hypothetical protein